MFFLTNAKSLPIVIDGQPQAAEPKRFSTNSVGWNVNGKVTLMVNGQPVRCQVSLNITAIGSKEWEESSTLAA
jgi:hypothetical protein